MRKGEPNPNYEPPKLGPRDLQILELISGNWTNAEIAEEFNLSPNHITNLLSIIYKKFGVQNRQEAKEKYIKLYPKK